MRKYFDCMACEHSQSIDGEKLQCVLRNKEVENHNSCLFQTNLPEEFPVSFACLKLEQDDVKEYPKFDKVEDLSQALERFEAELIKQKKKREKYIRENFLTPSEFSEQWENLEKKELNDEDSSWLLYEINREKSEFNHLDYYDWKPIWESLSLFVKFYQVFEQEESEDWRDIRKYYVIQFTNDKSLDCLIQEYKFEHEEQWFNQEAYEFFKREIYYAIAVNGLFPSVDTIEDSRVIPLFKKTIGDD